MTKHKICGALDASCTNSSGIPLKMTIPNLTKRNFKKKGIYSKESHAIHYRQWKLKNLRNKRKERIVLTSKTKWRLLSKAWVRIHLMIWHFWPVSMLSSTSSSFGEVQMIFHKAQLPSSVPRNQCTNSVQRWSLCWGRSHNSCCLCSRIVCSWIHTSEWPLTNA